MRDYYNILGVEPGASEAEIKRMYHKLSKKYHPDANITDPDLRKWSEARMKELNEAYNVLRDPLKRAEYDRRRGHVRPGPRPSSAPAARPSSPITQLRESIVIQSMAVNALIFGLFGLLRGGLPVALSGAVIGALIGAVLARIRIAGFPPAVSQGFLIGMFFGAILFKGALLAGVLVGGAIGALAGWWLMSR